MTSVKEKNGYLGKGSVWSIVYKEQRSNYCNESIFEYDPKIVSIISVVYVDDVLALTRTSNSFSMLSITKIQLCNLAKFLHLDLYQPVLSSLLYPQSPASDTRNVTIG